MRPLESKRAISPAEARIWSLAVPVVAVHAVIRAQPKKTVVVLSERKDPLLKRLTTNRERLEADILFLDYRKPLDSAIPRGGGRRLHPIGEDKNHCNRQKSPSQNRYCDALQLVGPPG